ncbi:MAG TPA: hypothetical protein V6D47_00350 [Oscillatoriaceae cyanobacterium]
MSTEKPYGFVITIRKHNGETEEIHRVTSSEARARRIGMMRPNAAEIEKLEPFAEQQYVRVFGRGRV